MVTFPVHPSVFAPQVSEDVIIHSLNLLHQSFALTNACTGISVIVKFVPITISLWNHNALSTFHLFL